MSPLSPPVPLPLPLPIPLPPPPPPHTRQNRLEQGFYAYKARLDPKVALHNFTTRNWDKTMWVHGSYKEQL